MREIKFRAWVKRDIKIDEVHEYMETDISNYLIPFDLHNTGKIVLLQYSGLKDKNDVEIYEGDILKCSALNGPYKAVLKFGKYYQDGSGGEYLPRAVSGFYVEALPNQLDKDGDPILYAFEITESLFEIFEDEKEIEVIGNIYEHPRLLEVNE